MKDTRWEAELATATALALEAGDLIRREFHRPGGPRSDGVSHADVDTEAEQRISEGLRAAFPNDAFIGEETPAWGARGAPRCWYVDPNDGTRAFIQGHRGSAVSIGLVCEGVPVVGVVYAPTAPDDGGDLITWAEGQPLRRNGHAVVRAPLVACLDGLSVVAMNADAAGSRLGSALGLVAPARLLARCSIAYRLALVAVGEADAALSLSGPTHYDVAGGHALLGAVGGVLLDASGQPFRFGPGGTGNTDVFGGHVAVAKGLAAKGRGAGVVRLSASPLDAAYPHVRPSHGRLVPDAAVLARAQGALLGQVAGDALGQVVAFRSRPELQAAHPDAVRELLDGGSSSTLAGQPTDDSELALMLARAIVAKGGFEDEAVRVAYRAWLDSRPFDAGGTTRRSPFGSRSADSEANGAAMRSAPLGVHLWRSPPDVVAELAMRDARLTHHHRECLEASAVLAVAIATAVREGPTPRALFDSVAAFVRHSGRFESGVKALFAADDVAPVEDFQRNQGRGLLALRNAFHQLLSAPSFEEAVVHTVSQGGVADSNGAIVGALVGAVAGRDAVPIRWRRAVLTCRAFQGAHPRPAALWATDLLELAERLAALSPPGSEASAGAR